MAIATKWQEVKCLDCGKLLEDPGKAVIQHDVRNGGLTGRHMKCPQPKPEPGQLQSGNAEPGPAPSPEYQRGWDDCYARVHKLLGEHFPIPSKPETP